MSKSSKKNRNYKVNKAPEAPAKNKWLEDLKKQLRKKKKQVIGGVIGTVAAAVLIGTAGYETWHYEQPKFQDLTIELGTETVRISDFMTEYARANKVGFVSDLSAVDLNKVGDYELTLSHGRQEQTVTLKVQDTTAPTADFIIKRVERVDYQPDPNDFVENVFDLSETTASFLIPPELPDDYADIMATVVVEDAWGNMIQEDCVISWMWMPENYTLELGDTLTPEMVLYNPEKDLAMLDQAQMDLINSSGVGTYEVQTAIGFRTNTCTVTVQDTKGPELELREVKRYLGRKADVDDFVASVFDHSGEVELRLLTELSFDTEGKFPVTIEAKDIHGNVTTGETLLVITTDTTPPKFSGLGTLSVEKNSNPDFLKGVKAVDKIDGNCEITYDVGKLDLSKAGTYYVTYRTSDTAGNVTTAKRKVVVEHDAADTAALVKSIANKLSDDPETIRNYVRGNIGYSKTWGGDDPVWYGFTNRTGNCYVHAMCLKAIYDLKGIESRMIWVTDKSHYWLQVKIGGGWKHIDPTPGRLHSKYSLMNDQQRLDTLSGRTWDTSKWPACK